MNVHELKDTGWSALSKAINTNAYTSVGNQGSKLVVCCMWESSIKKIPFPVFVVSHTGRAECNIVFHLWMAAVPILVSYLPTHNLNIPRYSPSKSWNGTRLSVLWASVRLFWRTGGRYNNKHLNTRLNHDTLVNRRPISQRPRKCSRTRKTVEKFTVLFLFTYS